LPDIFYNLTIILILFILADGVQILLLFSIGFYKKHLYILGINNFDVAAGGVVN